VADPETLWYWAAADHEVDFVDAERRLIEVKLGRTGPRDFAWYSTVFPKRKLLVVSDSEYQASAVKGITIEQFLLADGLPHPYPGQEPDADIYNDYGRFCIPDVTTNSLTHAEVVGRR
jgi:hypothetical protein